MSEIDKTGGPAYPVADVYFPNGQIQFGSTGMTLRDHFAGLAMPMAWDEEHKYPTHNGPSYKGVAERAYLMADAMLDARTKQ